MGARARERRLNALARASGNPGNSCIHITDEQTEGVLSAARAGARARASGMACDDSYAFACARALLLYQKQFSTLGVRKRSSRLFLAAQMHGTGV